MPGNNLLPPIIDAKFPTIFKLARLPLSELEKQLLGKGFKFCPDPGRVNTAENENAINELIRKFQINASMLNQREMESTRNQNSLEAEFS